MATGKSLLRKEIVKTLGSAIDHEMDNDENSAYMLYAESLKLVANALQFGQPDFNGQISDKKYKMNLLQFANQSLSRIHLILNRDEEVSPSKSYPPSAPTEKDVSAEKLDFSLHYKVMENELVDTESQILVDRYKQRMLSTPSAERQNLELELARQLVEKMAIVRKKFIEASTFAMQSGDRIFQIQEKLVNGTLKESDLKKQQLYGMSFQYHQCQPVLDISISDIRSTMRGQQLIRELITTVLDASGHPLNYALINMKKKVMSSLLSIPQELASFYTLAAGVKEDLNILIDTLKALFQELAKEKYFIFAFRIVHEYYFKDIKPYIIKYLRKCLDEVEDLLKNRLSEEPKEFLSVNVDEDCMKEAITKLHYLTTLNSPYDMIDCLTVVVKLLATSQFDRDHTSSIGTDDLLPRICHAILSSRLDTIHCEVEFVEAFTPCDQALGEGGYAVTTLSSALKYLLTPQ